MYTLDVLSLVKDYTCVNVVFDVDKTGGIFSIMAEKQDGTEIAIIDPNDSIERFVGSIMEDFKIQRVDHIELVAGRLQDSYDMFISFYYAGEPLLFDVVYKNGHFSQSYNTIK